MAEKRGQYQYNDDGTVAQLVQSNTVIDESRAIVPVDVQARLSQTIQTHSGVTIAPSGSSASTWIDCDGFDKLAITVMNDSASTNSVVVTWSNDNALTHGSETPIPSGTSTQKAGITDVKARYARVNLQNGDSGAPHVMSAWAYLKA